MIFRICVNTVGTIRMDGEGAKTFSGELCHIYM